MAWPEPCLAAPLRAGFFFPARSQFSINICRRARRIPPEHGGELECKFWLSTFLISIIAMKRILPASKSIPAWQRERAKKIHRACLCIQNAVARGEKISRYIRRTSRRYNGRKLKSYPLHQLMLCPGTLRRWWDIWKRNGRVPAALYLKFRARPPYVPRPLLMRFVEFCASNRLPSVKAAWRKFSALNRNHAAREISYSMVCYHFSADVFYLMQKLLKLTETAQTTLDQVKLAAVTNIAARLPERPPRRRARRETDFQI